MRTWILLIAAAIVGISAVASGIFPRRKAPIYY